MTSPAAWQRKYILLIPVASLVVFLAYVWFVGAYVPEYGKDAYDVFFPFRATHSSMNDIKTAPFHDYWMLPVFLAGFIGVAMGLDRAASSPRVGWRFFLFISYMATLAVGFSFIFLTPAGIEHLVRQSRSINNGIVWSLNHLSSSTEFMSLGVVGKLRYIFVDLCGTDKGYTIPGTTHPPGNFLVFILLGFLSKVFSFGSNMDSVAATWTVIVGVINSSLVPIGLSLARKIGDEGSARRGIFAVIAIPTICMHAFAMVDYFGSIFIMSGLWAILSSMEARDGGKSRKEYGLLVLSGTAFTMAAQMTYGHAIPVAIAIGCLIAHDALKREALSRILSRLGLAAMPALIYFVFEAFISGGKSFWIGRALNIASEVDGVLQTVRPYPVSQIANFVIIGIWGGYLFLPALLAQPESILRRLREIRVRVGSDAGLMYSCVFLLSFVALALNRTVHLEVERTWHWMMALAWPLMALMQHAIEEFVGASGYSKRASAFLVSLPQFLVSLTIAILVIDYY